MNQQQTLQLFTHLDTNVKAKLYKYFFSAYYNLAPLETPENKVLQKFLFCYHNQNYSFFPISYTNDGKNFINSYENITYEFPQ